MKIYRVGGFVRDKIIGINADDCDYVVIGSTPDEMKKNGFIQVGKSFPVFLHPKTKEEYALARKEKKSGKSHTDFMFEFSPDITLEEDLFRRDLTINAIAEDIITGEIIDPYNGIRDINSQILRHVSNAFIEDPLRVLRVARFAAKLNFSVAEETMLIMQNMANLQDIYTISRERIINELDKALECDYSSKFFRILNESKCLTIFFPTYEKILANCNQGDFLLLLDNATNKLDKYVLLGMLFIQYNHINELNEISYTKKIIQDIKDVYTISTFNIRHEAKEILKIYKRINLWRNNKNFKELLNKFKRYLELTKQSSDIVNTIEELAQILLDLDLSQLTTKLSGSELANEIIKLQIFKINQFKDKLDD